MSSEVASSGTGPVPASLDVTSPATTPPSSPSAPGVPTWEQIAREYGRFIYTVAYRLAGSHDDAQDLVQEVLVRVQRGLATYQPGSMEGWLSRITTNAFLDDVRRRRRRPAELLPDELDRLHVDARSVDEALALETLPDHVQEALRNLPDEFRIAVVMCDVVGQPYQEIADDLGVPVGTVRSRIHRGRSLLREALG
jgi:RNA polymerase sigma factor (sigma-70 family)